MRTQSACLFKILIANLWDGQFFQDADMVGIATVAKAAHTLEAKLPSFHVLLINLEFDRVSAALSRAALINRSFPVGVGQVDRVAGKATNQLLAIFGPIDAWKKFFLTG
jgi:hypothetical protein